MAVGDRAWSFGSLAPSTSQCAALTSALRTSGSTAQEIMDRASAVMPTPKAAATHGDIVVVVVVVVGVVIVVIVIVIVVVVDFPSLLRIYKRIKNSIGLCFFLSTMPRPRKTVQNLAVGLYFIKVLDKSTSLLRLENLPSTRPYAFSPIKRWTGFRYVLCTTIQAWTGLLACLTSCHI